MTGLIVIFVLGMMTVFYTENKKAIDKKSKKFNNIFDD